MSPFTKLYEVGGDGSGPGSSEEYTRSYRKFLEQFIREHHIRSILDYGCGDWKFSKLIDWGDATYYGIDEVDILIERLKVEHGNEKRIFIHSLDGVLPVDLVIVKDAIQHLPNQEILQIAATFKDCKYILWVNDASEIMYNPDCQRGGYRPINITALPFRFPVKVAFKFNDELCIKNNFSQGQPMKVVYLQTNKEIV
jgi:SAM-dependent methyltransferase